MFLNLGPGKKLFAIDAVNLSLFTREHHVIVHVDTCNFSSALVNTTYGIFLTRIQVSFESTKRARPTTAFVSVNAKYRRLQNFRFCHWITTQLQGWVGASFRIERVCVNIENHFLLYVSNFFIIWWTLGAITIVKICDCRVFITVVVYWQEFKWFCGNHFGEWNCFWSRLADTRPGHKFAQ